MFVSILAVYASLFVAASGVRAWLHDTSPTWPLEAQASDGLFITASCQIQHRGEDPLPISREGACEVTVFPRSRMLFLHYTLYGEDEDGHPPPVREQLLDIGNSKVSTATEPEQIIFRWFDDDGKHLSSLFVVSFADESASAAHEMYAKMADELAVPVDRGPATIQVDLSKPCHSEGNWNTKDAPGDGSVAVNWDAHSHHVKVSVSHRTETWTQERMLQEQKLAGEVLPEMEAFVGGWPESFRLVDVPPPSCYVDPTSPDCGHYEPHASTLHGVFDCLEINLDTKNGQLIAADFLRRVFFNLRAPISPYSLTTKAAFALHEAKTNLVLGQGERPDPLLALGGAWPSPLPDAVAHCLGITAADVVASPQIEAIACYLPMATVTGQGLLGHGTVDETRYEIQSSSTAALFLNTRFRRPTEQELKRNRKGFSGALVDATVEGPITKDNVLPGIPLNTIAEIRAPSMCARIVVDRLRRLSFLPYNRYAWFGNSRDPIKSLRPNSLTQCIEGTSLQPDHDIPYLSGTAGGSCRLYAGCVLRLMADFDKIPGVSTKAAAHCTGPSRGLVELDRSWMKTDNEYQMYTNFGGWGPRVELARTLDFWQRRWIASNRTKAFQEELSEGGFRPGDVVRINKPGREVNGRLYIVSALRGGPQKDRVCLRRGPADGAKTQYHCFLGNELEHVAAEDWELEDGTGVPVPASKRQA